MIDNIKTSVFREEDLEPLEREVENLSDAESLYILLKGVRYSYRPTTPVLCIAVGCDGVAYEGTIIRAFHRIRLGLNGQVKVVGCDRYDITPHTKTQDYDLYFGGVEGDAKEYPTWLKGINHFNSLYKFAFMNNPSVPVLDNWLEIYKKALSFVAEEGVIATVVEGIQDRVQLITLSSILEEDPMVESHMECFCRTNFMYGVRNLTFLELRRNQPKPPYK